MTTCILSGALFHASENPKPKLIYAPDHSICCTFSNLRPQAGPLLVLSHWSIMYNFTQVWCTWHLLHSNRIFQPSWFLRSSFIVVALKFRIRHLSVAAQRPSMSVRLCCISSSLLRLLSHFHFSYTDLSIYRYLQVLIHFAWVIHTLQSNLMVLVTSFHSLGCGAYWDILGSEFHKFGPWNFSSDVNKWRHTRLSISVSFLQWYTRVEFNSASVHLCAPAWAGVLVETFSSSEFHRCGIEI